MRHPVPPLDCTWTDVVFFSPVHLALSFDAIRSSGRINSGPQALHRLRNLNPTEPLLPFADIPPILHRRPRSHHASPHLSRSSHLKCQG
jgi:hypothetical protein